MNRETLRQNILELIRRTSAFLPPDVENVINLQRKLEAFGSKAKFALELVAQNIGLAKARSLPICQDTGTINFYFETPRGVDQLELEELCCDAVREATLRGYLRQNSVDSVDGKNTGDNLGPGSPVFHWEQTRDSNIHVRSEEHTSELQSPDHLVCSLLLEKKKPVMNDAWPASSRWSPDYNSPSRKWRLDLFQMVQRRRQVGWAYTSRESCNPWSYVHSGNS